MIPPREDGPFAQRTYLRWEIVGIVDYNNPGEDPIGSSHRIVTLQSQQARLLYQVTDQK